MSIHLFGQQTVDEEQKVVKLRFAYDVLTRTFASYRPASSVN